MAEKRDRYGRGGDPSIAPRANGYGSGNGNGGRGYNGRAPPTLGFDGEDSSVSGREQSDRRFESMPPNTPMTPFTPYTPYTPVTAGYDGGESFVSTDTPRHDRYYGGESAIGGRPAVTPGAAGYRGGESSYNGGTPQTGRFNGGESYPEGRAPRPGRYDIAESTMSVDTPRTGRFDPGMESSIAHPDTPRTAHYDTTATTMSMDPSRTGPYDKENTITVAEYYDPERAREHERHMMEREKSERERGMRQPSGMERGPQPGEYLSTSGSSTSSYLDISRHFPTKGFSFRSFFTTPSEKSDSKKKKEKKKAKKLTKHNSSSSSSLNEDLAFGTGFLRYRRKRSVRARDGRDRQWETIGYKSSKESLRDTRSATNDRPTSSRRPTTDADILAVGVGLAGLAKLALDHSKKDAKNGKNGRGVPETVTSSRRDERGLPPSKATPYETDPNDDEEWESASDDESDSSVDTGLAFGGGNHAGKKSQGGFFGRKKTHSLKSRKSNVVDPRLLGPENSLNGYLSDRAVGFEDVQWESGSDFGQHTYTPYSHPDRQVHTLYVHERVRVSRTHSVTSGPQTPLQEVFPVPTNDLSRFDVARASSSEYNASRPAPVPIQQPQPITPVSQSVYHEPNYVRSESGGILKSSTGRSKFLAGAALAGAAVGAAIASARRDEKENYRDDRRDNRSYSESAVTRRDSDRKERRYEEDQYSLADSSVSRPRDEDRKERRRDYDQSSIADSNLTWDEKREKRREERRKDDSRSSTSNSDRDKNREKSRDDPDAAAEERERRRRERREERRAPDRIEDNYEERRAHVLSEISAMARTPADPFQYQVADSPTLQESSSRQAKDQSTPTVVTVEREPEFNRNQNSSINEPSSISRSEPRTEVSDKDDKEQQYKEHSRTLHDAERIYEETEHSTAPIEAAAIAAAAAALARETRRESRSSKRRGERRTDSEDLLKDSDSINGPEKSHDDVMAEADRAYREIVMARKVAAEVRRSRTPSPERSVMNKYEEESEEEEPTRIVTPPGMHERKKGPYGPPNADFKLDYIMTPRDLKVYSIPSRRYKVDQADLKGPFMTKDADARLPRPLLNLILPTPTSTPSPEKQFASMAKNVNVKKGSSNRSDDCPDERRRSEPKPEPEPEPERHSKTEDKIEEREQATIRSQDEPAQPRDTIEDREQTSSYRSHDKSDEIAQVREETPSNRSKDESHDQNRPKCYRKDIPPIIIGPRGDLIRSPDVSVPSPTQSTVSKAVTWGSNETKHFEVESPTEQKDEYTSESSPETPEKPRYQEPRLESQTEPKSPGGWAAMAAGIIGAGMGAAVEGSTRESERPESPKRAEIIELARILKERERERPESPKKPERAEVSELARILKARESERPESPKRAEVSELARILKAREQERNERPYEYRGVVVEPESPYGEPRRNSPPQDTGRDSMYRGVIVEPESPHGEVRSQSPPRNNRRESLSQHTRRDSPPSVGPKPVSPQTPHMPGAFDDDLDFTATVAAGLEDTGFNPDLVIDSPAFRKRNSPPGSNEYKTPWAESIDDLSSTPGESSSNRGFVMGEVPETPKDWSSVSPSNEESPNLSRKEQRKLDKERRRSGGDLSSPITNVIVEEPESYFDSSRQSRKEQKRREKEETRTQSLLREESSFVDLLPDRELVDEPENYVDSVDTPKKSKKSSLSSTYEDIDLDSKPKRKSSKRSLTYDGKVDSPLRESRRTFSMDDIKNGDESKIPRKSKRDSVRFDSPSNSPPPAEVDYESGRSLRRKSKEKLESKSERYDSPDPSQISLPAADNYEDMELSREPDRPSRRDGDDPLWASSRSILSADSSSKVDEEDSPQKKRKDRSSTKENNDATRSIASDPTRDDNEDSKKKAKETTPKKSGGLFGFFSGAKAEVVKEELTKGSRDDPDDVKKKKKKRSSTSDGITEGQAFSDSQLVSSETNGHKTLGEDDVQDSRNDGERRRSKSSDSKKSSFLDNAGILGAGAGLAAGAIAISAQHQQQHAANNNDSEGSTGEMGKQEREEDILDPEIIERQIRPSIDPQYGDLLPLPPSGSVSPNCEPIDDLPKLPESRPTTPESEKRTVSTPREKTPRNRKSLQETPVKSPSQSAVPLKFVMGNRSNPASPIITRSTGNTPFHTFHPSPIAESATIPRSRSRPMSWDNTKEFKPLYLLETNRRGSFLPEELIDPLPHLPRSRTNSELDVADLPESGFLEKLDLHRPSLDPLSTNLLSDDHTCGESTPTAITFKRDLAPSVEFLQDSFPSVEEKQTLSSDAFHKQSSSESVAKAIGAAGIATAAGLAFVSHDTSNEQEPRSSQEIQNKSGNDHLEYPSESHDTPSEQEETLQTLSGTSRNQTMSIEEEVEPTKEFPLSDFKKNEGKCLTLESDDIHDQAENTPEPIQELSTPIEAENIESVDSFSTPKSKNNQGKNGTALLSQEPELELQSEIPSQEDTQGPKSDYASSEPHDVTGPVRDLIKQAATSEIQPVEYPTQNSEEEKAHEKADTNGLSLEPELKTKTVDSVEPLKPMDDDPSIDKSVEELQEQMPESSQIEEALPSAEINSAEELSVLKSKKDRKDEKKAKSDTPKLQGLISEPIVESMIEVPMRERSLEVSPELSREISEPSSPLANSETQAFDDSVLPENSGDITPIASEFSSPKSKRDKRKSKKSKPIPLDPQPEQVVVQPELDESKVSQSEDGTRNSLDLSQDLIQETIQEPTTPVNVEPIEEFSTPKSKKSKDKNKAKKEQIANVEQEPIDVIQEQEQVPESQEKELPETFAFEETTVLDDTTHAIASSMKDTNEDKNGKTADIEESMEPLIPGPNSESVSEKPTPMVGPGGWPITPAMPWTAGAKETSTSNEKDYFPAAETILPIITAGDTVPGSEQLKSNDISQDKKGPDSFTAGHEDDQLSLANALPEESKPQEIVIEDVSKGLERDVTESNGLSVIAQEDESSLPRQLPAEIEESIEENHTPQEEQDHVPTIEIQEEEKPISNETETPVGFEAGHQDDQQALPQDLKDELESGSAKDEKDEESEKHANQDQDELVPSYTASSDNAIQDLNEPTNVPTSQTEIIEEPATKPVLEEPEETEQADKKPQTPGDVINEQTPLEETSTTVQEPETIENVHIDQDFPEPAMTETAPIDLTILTLEPEVKTESEESKKRDTLLASNPSEDIMTPGTLEEKMSVDTFPEQLEPEHSQSLDESSIAFDFKPESNTLDKSQDNVVEPTPIEEVSVPENVDQVNNEEEKTQGEESADVKQDLPDTPLEPSTVDRGIEFSAPPKKSEKDKNKRGKQVQDLVEDDTVAKDTKPTGESSNIEMPIEHPNDMPVEQFITIPAKEPALNDAPSTPMTAGLSGLMGPLTGRKKGVLEMVQALGWGKKKDKAAIAAAEQGLPPRPSTARAASESFMSTPRIVSESAMPKVIETEPVKAPSPTTELEEWALADENFKTNSKKGKKFASEDFEPAPSTIIEEETLPIEPKEEIAEQTTEPSVMKSTEDLQDDQTPKREKGKKRHSLQSFISEEASKAFRTRESANQGSDISRDDVLENEPKLQAPEINEPFVESSSEPSEIQREPTLEEIQAPEVSIGDAPEPIIETPREPEEFNREAIQNDSLTSLPQSEHIPEQIAENHSQSSDSRRAIDQESIFVPEPLLGDTPEQAILERSNEPSNTPLEVIQDDNNVSQAPFDLATEPSTIGNGASPNEHTLEKVTKNVNIPEPSLVDESLPYESIQNDIMASVEYVDPDTSLQESKLSVEPLSEELDNTIEVDKPGIVDELSLPSHTALEEDSREVEVAEPNHNVDKSFSPREPLLEESSKGTDESLPNQVVPQEESGVLETFEQSHADEESPLSTEPAEKVETVQPPSEIDLEKTDVRDEPTSPETKKSQSELEVPIEVTKEPEQTLLVEDQILEKSSDTTESINREALEQPLERSVETIEPGSRNFLEPASVPLPDDDVNEAIELDEPTNFENLQPSLDLSPSTPISEENIVHPETEEHKSLENIDYSEHAASIPLPEDIVMNSDEDIEHQGHELAEALEPVLNGVEKESLSSDSLLESETKAIEPAPEEARLVFSDPPIAEPLEGMMFSKPQEDEIISRMINPETEQNGIEPVGDITTPSISDEIEHVSQEELVEPPAEVPAKKDKKQQVSEVPVLDAEDISSHAPLERLPTQPDVDVSNQETFPNSIESIPESVQTANENTSIPTLNDVEVKQDDTPESGLDVPLQQRDLESVSKDVVDLPETNSSDAPVKEFKGDNEKRKSLDTNPTLELPTDSTPEMNDLSQPIDQAPEEKLHGIEPGETARETAQQPIALQEHALEQEQTEEDPEVSVDPVIESTASEPPTNIYHGPTVESENDKEDDLTPQESVVQQESTNASKSIEEPSLLPHQIIEPESVNEETFLPQNSMINSSINDEEAPQSHERFLEPESRNEESFVPQESTIELRISEERTSQQELETVPKISNLESSLVQDSVVKPIPEEEQIAVKKPVVELNIPEPEQIALPESPIEQTSFEPELSFPQEPLTEPEIIEEAPAVQDRASDSQSPDIKLVIPQVSSLEQKLVEPAQISLPESPIERKVSELGTPSQQELDSENYIFKEPSLSREHRVEPKSSRLELVDHSEQKTVESEQIALPESPIEQEPFEPEVLFRQEPVTESQDYPFPSDPSELLFEEKTVEPEQIALPESPIAQEPFEPEVLFRQEPVTESQDHPVPSDPSELPFEEKTVEPEQIALPESPIAQESFEPEVLFRQEPVTESQDYPFPSDPSELTFEEKATEKESSFPQGVADPDITEKALIPQEQDINSKTSEQESIVSQESPIEQSIRQPLVFNIEEPISESKPMEDMTAPQESSIEPTKLESNVSIPDLEPVFPNESGKDKEEREYNLDFSETSRDPSNVTSTSQVPENQALEIVSESTPSDFVIEPIDAEPTAIEQAINPTLETTSFNSTLEDPVHDQPLAESLPAETRPIQRDEWAWFIEESKEVGEKGDDVLPSIQGQSDTTPQTPEITSTPLDITDVSSMGDDVKDLANGNLTETDEDLFLDAVESFSVDDTPMNFTPRASREAVEAEFEELTQQPVEQSIPEAIKPFHEKEFIPAPMPETVQQNDDVFPDYEEITLDEVKSNPVDELSKIDLPRQMLNGEHLKEEHRPADDDVTEVLTKNSKDINDREFGFSSPVQFIPKDTQIGVPDVVEPVPTEITLDEFKAIPTGEMPKEVQQQTEDEWGSISSKKSIKDKEILQSTLSTPLEPEVSNVATELPEDIPSNSGKLQEPLPTIEDVSDTHTSFQIPQVDKIVSEHDPSDMSHDKNDKKGKEISNRELDPEQKVPALANTVAVSDIQDVKPGERLLTSPIPIRNTVPISNSIAEPDIISPPSPSPLKPVIDESNNLSTALVQIPSKKDKRKRQATTNLDTPKDGQRTFWAGEVPEAEVIRAVPVIEDIGRDEFYSHIASTVKETEANEFSRPPAKKGKKNTRRESTDIKDFQLSMGENSPKVKSMKERKEMPSAVAATAAIISAALLASKSKKAEVEDVEEEESRPMIEKLPEKEEHGLSMGKIASSDDVSNDFALWRNKQSNLFQEMKAGPRKKKSDGHDSDRSRERDTIVQESGQIGNNLDPMIETSDKAAAIEPQENRIPRSLSPVLDIARLTQEPKQIEPMQQKEFAETSESDKVERSILHEPEESNSIQKSTMQIPTEHAEDENSIVQERKQMDTVQNLTTQVPAEPTIVERQIVQESEQIGAPQESMVQIPTRPLIMEDSEKPRGDLPEEYLSRPSRRDIEKKRRKKSIEVDDTLDLLPAPIQEALRNTIVEPRAREISPSPISSPIAERAKRARSRSRPPSRPGTPGLTMLREESEDENALKVDNRDSAFISDSPIPPQGNFADKQDGIRDSGIHLRDNSPSTRVRAPVSSTDAAIDSMAWPPVDEDAGTVDLEQPQRPKVVEDLTRQGHEIDDLPSQRHKEERHTDLHRTQAIQRARSPNEEKHKLARKTSLSRGELAEANHVDFVRSQRLKAFQTKSKEKLSEPPRAEPINKPVTPEKERTRHRVHRSELPDLQYRKPKENKYGDLESAQTPKTPKNEQRSKSESSPSLIGSAALAAAGSGFAAARKLSQESRPLSAQSHKSQRSASNISVTRLRTSIPLDAPQAPQLPDSAKTNRSFTPPLRRSARKISGDPRSLRQQSNIDLAKEIDPASVNTATSTTLTNTANPTANEGRARAQDMADVYDGYGEGHMGSPRSPTRPHSMRRRQSMQVLELESKLDQLTAENRALAESKAHAEHMLRSSQGAPAALVERDAQIDLLKRTLSSMQDEVKRLTEVNAGLSSAAVTLGQQHNARYGTLESQHAQTSRELQQAREAHHNLQSEVQGVIHNAIQERDQEIASLRSQLDVAKEQIRAMQREILAAKAGDAQFLIIRDEDYFDNACQQLCQHVQQWVLRFSKFSDMRACRLTSEINNDKTIDRLDNAILDGSDVDSYLADRVRRRDVFMSMTMTMVWEFIFTRYLFGMDREQRQKLKSLEKVLSEVGPPSAVHQWRATTLTLLSKRDSFARQKEQDTLAVVHAVFETLTEILPPPSHLEGQIEEQLKRVIKAAVDLSIEMRTQRAEFMMLPPLQPEYDANGDLASKVSFNAALMNERSGDTISNEELEAQRAVVRVVLFPLVVKKGDDLGQGDEEIVVCPAQVLVAKPKMGKGPVGRVYSPAGGMDMDKRSDRSRTPASLQSSMPDNNVI
ncbi:hypothetical protein BOTCAL_0361g00010 [Botryotinia calthae]|uniref:Involucrin repeat protein n=1 Tax=Botryotinia calthae TaxID=38488 RepID=A0A4Y8CUT9_9HELO|nr:hypothetical protein BOTCAL_0361g00010 [Botryotinia calthae]